MNQQTDEPTTPESEEFWWGKSPTVPPLPEIPVAQLKVGDEIQYTSLLKFTILGVRLVLRPHQDYPTGWDKTPTWEYNLWHWWHYPRFDTYSYDEWGWVPEAEVLKRVKEFQEQQAK